MEGKPVLDIFILPQESYLNNSYWLHPFLQFPHDIKMASAEISLAVVPFVLVQSNRTPPLLC